MPHRFSLYSPLLIPLVAAWTLPITAAAATFPVPATYPTIQDGLDAAAGGDTVLVAPGNYSGPGNRDLDFAGKAIRLFSSGGASATKIDCGGSPGDPHRAILIDDNEPGVFVDGFRFVNGYAFGPTGSRDGGAVLIDGGGLSASVIIRDCEFFGNHAPDFGGAVAVRNLGNLTMIHCRLAGNSAGSGGGVAVTAAFSAHLTECALTGNAATGGGGLFLDSSTLTGNLNTISGNHATNVGGGILGLLNADLGMDYSIIWGNCANGSGDAIYVQLSGNFVFNCSDVDTLESIFPAGSIVTYNPDVIAEDPVFCGPASCDLAPTPIGWYGLAAASPCLVVNNGCGQMGRYGLGCSSLGVPGNEEGPERIPGLLAAPNPARGSVQILLTGGVAENAGMLSVYGVDGRLVRSLPVGRGTEQVVWDGTDLDGKRVAAGVYLLRLVAGARAVTGRLVIGW